MTLNLNRRPYIQNTKHFHLRSCISVTFFVYPLANIKCNKSKASMLS
jgi:hypothetical protein